MYGFTDNIARINLTTKTVEIEHWGEQFYRRYLGGRNIVGYVLQREIPAGVDPLGPDNKLVVATSIMTGSPIAGSSRFSMGAKSPLTDGYGESEAGGFFGPELKFAGFDALIIEGASEEPCYIWINDDNIEIRDGKSIWGTETGEAEDVIRAEIGEPKARILQTGIAGENLVRYAAVTTSLKHWCGRSGMGAVMGSKNLRAIAVKGSNRKLNMKNPDKVSEFCKWFVEEYRRHEGLQFKTETGTAGVTEIVDGMGLLPTHNFTEGSFADIDEISGAKMNNEMVKKKEGCFACPIRCKRVVSYKDDEIEVNPLYGGPEYETVGILGSNCGIKSLKHICKANELCGRYGVDTIGMGATISFAMECFANGILTLEDTDGLDLTFGNETTLLKLIEVIVKKEGRLGVLLAEGSYRASQELGGDAPKYAMTTRKQEFPAHEARGKWNVALGFAVSPTGADHLVTAHDPSFENEPNTDLEYTYMDLFPLREFGIFEPQPSQSLNPKKLQLFTILQTMWGIYNVLDVCIFVGVPEYRMVKLEQWVKVINDITGWDFSLWELMKTSERGIQLARIFNVKQGMGKEWDCLPERLFEPLVGGAREGACVDKAEFEQAVKYYYEMMGWNTDGVPTMGKFIELGMDELHCL